MDAVIGLGSNLGSREAMLRAAIALLDLEVVATSKLYRTPPLGPPQPEYLNAAVRVRSDRSPEELLAELQRVEKLLGRVRRERWGPRTIDLDFLWWEGGKVDVPGLTVPHPGLLERAFALAPLLDVAPEQPWSDRLWELGPPAAMPWSAVSQLDDRIEVRAADDADALALALGAALGGADMPSSVETIEASSPAELVQKATERCADQSATVAVERLDAGFARAHLALGRRQNRRPRTPRLDGLGGCRCRITLEPNLL